MSRLLGLRHDWFILLVCAVCIVVSMLLGVILLLNEYIPI